MIKDLCFEIIERCPNNCMFCSSLSTPNAKRKISYVDFERTILYLQNKFGIEEVSLSGGEPLLHEDILKMVSLCTSLGIKTVLFTSGVTLQNKNGIICTDKRYNSTEYSAINRDILRKLKSSGLSKIVFDFQAYEEDDYNKLMGTQRHMIYMLNSILYSYFEGLQIEVHFIPNKLNYKSLPDILECLDVVEAKQLSLLNFVPQGRGRINSEQLMLSKEEMEEFIKIYESVKDKYKTEIRVGIPLSSQDNHKCTAGMGKFDIKFDGTVLPCPAFKEIDIEELKQYGVKKINIYENLDELEIYTGTRTKPLCRRIYNMTQTGL